jgi:hypothetical protein
VGGTSGSDQTATVTTAFASPLVAQVTDSRGNPVPDASVTFVAPISGASGSFANGTNTETDTTDATGTATSSVFTANATLGSFSVSASAAGAMTGASFSLTNVAQGSPTITGFSPGSGPPGTVVTIKGTNLERATKVQIGATAVTIDKDSATKLKVTVPPGATSGKMKVKTPGGTEKTVTNFNVS